MTLIKSISGIRGTIGGQPGDTLSPLDIVKFTSAYGQWAVENTGIKKVVIGRDARLSGSMVSQIVSGTLQGLGIDVVDLVLSTTPTVEIAVTKEQAAGGIIITASHNPVEWNALKLLNNKGEFVSGSDGEEILALAESEAYNYAEVHKLGTYSTREDYIDIHIEDVLALPLVDVDAIKKARFKVAIDAVNSTGGIAVPALLKAMGVEVVKELYCEPNGLFPHNPEPLPENLTEIAAVMKQGYDVGIVVDPDVDRLALVCEDGSMFGEEYTLVAVADYVLGALGGGNTVSNLSSSRALRDITSKHGGQYTASAVGEVNVVTQMKATNATIGGEGNGGIIYPDSHYGRDSLVGIALLLTHLAKTGKKLSALKAEYPEYHISKNKIELTPEIDVDALLVAIEKNYENEEVNTIDGVKIDFENEWVHLRKSNTEPIIRIIAEAQNKASAEKLALSMIEKIKQIAGL